MLQRRQSADSTRDARCLAVEQDGVVWAALTGEANRDSGERMRMSMAEVFVRRDGLITERRAWVIPLTENDHR